jgi:superfamily II DNA or RNA helicase
LGKTEIFTDPSLLDEVLDAGQRVLIIAHTDELIDQAYRKAKQANPLRRVGIVKSVRNEAHAQIVVSSRQTLQSEKRRNMIRNVGLIIVDEAHHAVRTNTYGKILEHYGCFCEPDPKRPGRCMEHLTDCHPKVAGFTATLARSDKAKLSSVWQVPDGGRIFSRDILFGIRRGYLLDVTGHRIVVPDLNMGNVRQSRGDYQDTDIAEELERTYAPEIVARDYRRVAGERKGIAFWPLVETAYHGEKAFREAGITSETIHGELPKPERRAILQRLHTGETQVVHGVGVLTEGFDEPTVDVVVVARPTRSAPLYQQMVGRVLRPNLELAPAERGKALILDVVGAGAEHDLRSLVDLAPQRPLRRDDEELSLLELDEELIGIEEQQATAAGPVFEEEIYAGETEVREFDPLGRERLWARTPEGSWYMSAGGVAYVFLTPSLAGDPGTWDVVMCSKVNREIRPWAKATDYAGLPLEEALSYAEDLTLEVGGTGTKTLTSRKSKWRRDEPTGPQKAWATRNGIAIVKPDGTPLNKGELSELRDAWEAARRIDPLVRSVRAAYSE